MAIQIALQSSDMGITFAEAYARVGRFSGDKESIRYVVEIYASAETRATRRRPIQTQEYSVPYANVAGEILPALYADLKMRPGYDNAEDC